MKANTDVKMFRIDFIPVGSFHFAQPNGQNLGNRQDYYHQTRYFPTQIAVLGTLRRAIGVANRMLDARERNIIKIDELNKLIGDYTSLEETGIVTSISPILLKDKSAHYLYTQGSVHWKHEKVEEWEDAKSTLKTPSPDKPGFSASFPLLDSEKTFNIIPLEEVKGKTTFEGAFIPIDNTGKADKKQAVKQSELLKTSTREHVNTTRDGKEDLEGFFVMKRLIAAREGLRYTCYVKCTNAEAINKVSGHVVPLGGHDNQFRMSVEECEMPDWISNDLSYAEGKQITLLSPMGVPTKYMLNVDLAHTEPYTHSYLDRSHENNLDQVYARPVFAEAKRWIDTGSDLWSLDKSAQLAIYNSTINWTRLGYNHFYIHS